MSSKTKKFTAVLFAFAAAVCMALALFFGVQPRTASAEGELTPVDGVLELTEENLAIDAAGVITGFKDETVTKAIADAKSYTLTIGGNTAKSVKGSARYSEGVFYNQSKLTKLEITAANLTEIGDYAFYGTTGLTSLTLNNALTDIGKSAFEVNVNTTAKLDTITVPENVENIGGRAFANRAYLTTINFDATECNDFATIEGATTTALSASISNAAENNPFYRAGAYSSTNSVTVNLGHLGGTAVKKIPAAMFIASNRANNRITTVKFNNVTLADGAFGNYSFCYCNNLTSVQFLNSSSVVSIGTGAFYNCSSLGSLPEGIVMPSGLIKIGSGAFYNCTSLTGISIPDGVTVISDSSFRNCSSLESVNLNKAVTISANAFYQCAALEAIAIPDSVTSIGASAFAECTNLKSVSVNTGAGLTSISQRAFANCGSLEIIIIPRGVQTIGDAAYTGCVSVKQIDYYATNANNFASGNSHPFGGVGSAGSGIKVNITGTATSKISNIPENMFYYSGSALNVTSVTMTSVQAEISASAFRGCANLKDVVFADCTVTKIGNNAFNGCSALTNFHLPSGIEEIGNQAFQSCSSLLTLTLPASLNSIGNLAFNNCKRLFEIQNLSGLSLTKGSDNNGQVAKYALSIIGENDASAIKTSSNPDLGSVGLYFIQKDNKYYLIGTISELEGEVVLPVSVPGLTNQGYDIDEHAFDGLNKISSVQIPSTVSDIGDYAFYNCVALETVQIVENGTDGVKEIGQNAFAGCSSLTTIKLPSQLNIIDIGLFSHCTSLTQIVIPETVTRIWSNAFDSTGLTSVIIPSSVTAIDPSAFNDCSSLGKVTFLAKENIEEGESKYSITDIGDSAFQNCTSLVSIVIPETVTRIDSNAFSGASSLITVHLPARATYGDNVFSGCNANIAIISTKDTYTNDLAALKNNPALTYVIEVKLVYDGNEANAETVNKLYRRDYSYELQPDNITWKSTGSKVPVQNGYSKSVWYSDATHESSKALTETQITGMLWGDGTVTLYAQFFAKPAQYTLTDNLNYAKFEDNQLNIDADHLAEINAALFANPVLEEEHVFKLIGYIPFSGSVQQPLDYVQNAGTYTLEIKLNSAYGEWDEPFLLTFTVEKSVVDISDTDELNWGIATTGGTALLNSEKLWVPTSGSGDPYLAESENGIPNGYEERYIEQSVARYNGLNWELKVDHPDDNKFTVDDLSYRNRNARDIGIYRAEAVITPTNNYSLRPGTFKYGISCTPNNSSDGSYTVYKVWYIVAMANTLWMPGGGERYHIDGWTYNQANIADVIPGAPALSYGVNSENEFVTFTLSLDVDGVKTDIVSADHPATYNDFSKWINRSMPAGEYTLTINVRAPQSDVADMHETYVFTVAKARLDTGVAEYLVSSVNEKLNGKNFSYPYDGRTKVAYEEIEAVIAGVNQTMLNPNRFIATSNAWSSHEYDGYFGEFSIGYSVSTMTSNAYLSLGELDASQYAPKDAGEYTVYYQLSAPNYELLAASVDNKWDYAFSVVIYEQVDAKALLAGSYTYTGEIIMPLTSSDRYQVISLEAGETLVDSELTALELTVADRNYTDVGTPKIVIKILNPSIYKWKTANDGSATVFGENDEYLLVNFTIGRCENYTKGALDIIRWSWGNYNPAVNIPIWTTGFGNEYTYTLTSTTNSRTYSQERFGEAPAGEYTLTARAAGGEGYNWNAFSATATINILKADNYWDVVPTVYGWSYGEYATRVLGPAAKPHFGDASAVTTSYYKLNADGAIEGMKYDSIDRLLEGGELPVGEYLMRVEVAGTSNYNAMPVTDIRFRVSKAYNGWLSVPYVVGWSEGRFNRTDNALNKGEVKFGEIIIKVTDSEGKEINVENFDKLSVGNYTVTAYVAGTDDYYEMQPITTTFAVVEDSVSMTGLIAATMVFAVLAVGLAVAAVVLLVLRSRKIEAEFRKMIKKELGRK